MSKVKVSTKVITLGTKPRRRYYAYLNVGDQGFGVLPCYEEGLEEAPEASAAHMAEMLLSAMERIASEGCEVEPGA